MRSYVIDDLTCDQCQNITKQLDAMNLGSGIEGIYWLPIPQTFYSDIQKEHMEKCGPYIMALEIDEACLRLELLVRAKSILHCNCVSYAQPELEQYIMRYVDSLLTQD